MIKGYQNDFGLLFFNTDLIPGASLEWLSEQLPGLEPEQAATIVLKASDLLETSHS